MSKRQGLANAKRAAQPPIISSFHGSVPSATQFKSLYVSQGRPLGAAHGDTRGARPLLPAQMRSGGWTSPHKGPFSLTSPPLQHSFDVAGRRRAGAAERAGLKS